MKLDEKISYLKPDNAVQELTNLLDNSENVKTTISWWGQRLVSLDKFDGFATIDQVARKYLKASAFDIDNTERSLEDRLQADNLWEKVENLYTESDKELAKTRFYKYLVPLIEVFKIFSNAPQKIFRDEISAMFYRNHLFYFTPENFRTFFGEDEKKGEVYTLGKANSTRWLASKEMVKSLVFTRKVISSAFN